VNHHDFSLTLSQISPLTNYNRSQADKAFAGDADETLWAFDL
jgi:hypothetical protein